MYIYIRAMLESQNKIYDKLTAHSVELDEHLIKICLYPFRQEVTHWSDEIYSFVHVVQKLQGKNKLPSEKFILKALSTNEDIIDNLVSGIVDDYGEVDYALDNVEEFVQSYHLWLSHELATKGVVSRSSVQSEIFMLRDILCKH